MKKNHLTVIARLRAKPGKESELRKALHGLITPTRAETGCLKYDLHESNEKPGLFFFYETWTNAESLAKHFETPHLIEIQRRTPDLLAEPLELHSLSRIS